MFMLSSQRQCLCAQGTTYSGCGQGRRQSLSVCAIGRLSCPRRRWPGTRGGESNTTVRRCAAKSRVHYVGDFEVPGERRQESVGVRGKDHGAREHSSFRLKDEDSCIFNRGSEVRVGCELHQEGQASVDRSENH